MTLRPAPDLSSGRNDLGSGRKKAPLRPGLRNWALASGLLLVACTPPATPDQNVLKDQNVTLGYGLSAQVQQPFKGTWRIEGLPSWLTATPESGTNDVLTVLTANRRAGTPSSAAQATLAADVKLSWTAASTSGAAGSGTPGSSAVGSATLKVSADLYRLTGQVQGSAASLGLNRQDLNYSGLDPAGAAPLRTGGVRATLPSSLPVGGSPGVQDVIVEYRSQSARVQAMNTVTGSAATPATQTPAAQTPAAQTPTAQTSPQSVPGERLRSAVGQTLTLSTPDVEATLARLRGQPEVAYAVAGAVFSALDLDQPTRQITGQAVAGQAFTGQTVTAQQLLAAPLNPTDEYAPLQWAYRLLGYPAVWRDMQQRPYQKAVTVAVLDTGVRYDHPDLKGRLYGPGDGALDLLSSKTNGDGDGPDTDPTDPATPGRTDISHGTHVTGIIAATWGSFAPPCPSCSGSGVVGATYTAPVKVLPIRVLDAPDGNGSESDIALALRYAAGDPVTVTNAQGVGQTYTNPHPAAVINLSLGGPLTDTLQIKVICDAVARATDLGALVVAAGGNFSGTAPIYPAACPGAVSVASVSLSETAVPQHAYYSDRYPQVALSAPGGNPGTAYNGGTLSGQPMPDEILSTGWNYAANLPGYYLEAGTSQAAPQVTALAALLLSKGTVTTASAALARMVATATDLGAPGRDDTYGAGLINPAAALGAPAVSNALGLTVQDDGGGSYQPALDSVGRFTAYLPDGAFRLLAGRDSNGNGLAGETGEPRAEKSVTLGPALPTLDTGTLTP
ncbi:S8 family serine peptidase [Deinococcus radiomollis]|uniref:S8 family serine peptidase n=1 Tax=Deinococcus radiomollis TaxID=468916 RepID=UPI003891A60C